MKDIPETIFLQIDEYGKDAESFKELETTWCTDKLNEDDIEYILKLKYEELEQQKAELIELLSDISHFTKIISKKTQCYPAWWHRMENFLKKYGVEI